MNTLAQETPTTVEPSIIQQTLHSIVVTVFGWFVGATGTAFDWVVKEFILEFGENYKTTNIGAVIDNLWSTVRDIFNLTFIFGLVWIGFQMILGNNSNAQRSLGYLIAAALLVNFSLFITKFVVDFANIAAIQINNAFTGTGTISEGFINNIALTQALNFTDFESGAGSYAYIFGLMVLFLVTAFVFAAGAVLITIRYIALNIYLVLSPIMFLGWVFPGMARYSKEYWSGFLGRAFFAPAYMFMLYLSFQIVSQYREGRPGGDIAAMFNQSRDAATTGEIMGYFILATGFMLASLVVAQKMGANGATAAIAVGQRMRKGGQRMLTQPGRYVARNTVNKVGIGAEQSFNRLQNSNPNSRLGRFVAKAARGTAMDEFVRNTTTKAKGAKFGMTTTVSENRTRRDAIQSRYQGSEDARTAAAELSELTSLRERQTLDQLNVKIAAGSATNEEIATHASLTTKYVGHTALTATDTARKAQLETTEAKNRKNASLLSTAQIEALTDRERSAIAPYLTNAQNEKISESKELDDTQKKAMTDARVSAIEDIIAANVKEVSKLSVEQLELMGEDFIKDQAQRGNLKQTQIDDLKKSKKFTEAQRDNFSKIHTAGQRTNVQNKIASGVGLDQLSTTELESLGAAELTRNGVIQHLTKSQIDDLKKSKGLNDDEKRSLENERNRLQRAGFDAQFFRNPNGSPKSPSIIANLPRELLMDTNAMKFLTADVLQKINKDGSLGAADQVTLKNRILAAPNAADRIGAPFFTTNYAITNWG